MNQLGAAVALEARLDGRPVLELEAIYREHSATVSKWVRRMWGPAAASGLVDSEDLLQEVFLVVQRRLDSYRFEAALTTWLYGITVLVVNARRRKERWRRLLWRRVEPQLGSQHEPVPPAEDDFERAQAARAVYAVLNELGERDRTLLILFELDHRPGAEIASVLGMSEPSVWTSLTRARERFRKVFERRYGDGNTSERASHVES